MRHRQRTADARFDLAERHEHGGARDVPARLAIPAEPSQAGLDPDPHQLVPGGMELDLVVLPQDGWMLVREVAQPQRLGAA